MLKPMPIWTMRIDLVSDKTRLVHNPAKQCYEQEADEHQQSGQKPDLLLMRGQSWFSRASVMICHNFPILYVGQRRIRYKVFTPYRLPTCEQIICKICFR